MHYSTVQIMYFYVRNNERRTVNTVSGSSLGAPKSQRRSSTKQQNAELPNDVLERDSNVSWRRRLLKKLPHRNVLLLKPFLRNRNPFPKNWTFHRRSDIRNVLVESEPSSPTSSSTHSDSQVSSVALPATLHEEQAILKDFLASNSNIDSDDDFGDTGVCANCRGN